MEIRIYQYEEIRENQTEKDRDYTVADLMRGKKPTQDIVNKYYTKMCNITINNNEYKAQEDYAICEDMYAKFNSDDRQMVKHLEVCA